MESASIFSGRSRSRSRLQFIDSGALVVAKTKKKRSKFARYLFETTLEIVSLWLILRSPEVIVGQIYQNTIFLRIGDIISVTTLGSRLREKAIDRF